MANDKLTRDKERLPESEADPEYPYYKPYTSPSGHKSEIDDTPGKERLLQAHRSGSYREVSPDGKEVDCVVGNRHMYTKGTAVITIDGAVDFKASGGRIVIMGGTLVEIVGQLDIVIYGDANIVVAEKAKIMAQEEILISSDKDINIYSGKDVNIDAKRDIKLIAGRNISETAKSVTQTADAIDMNSSGE